MVVETPKELKDDDGVVRYCVVQTYGDTTHTLYDLSNYKGFYLPGYREAKPDADPIIKQLWVMCSFHDVALTFKIYPRVHVTSYNG